MLYARATWANASLLLNPIVAALVGALIRGGRKITLGGVPIEEVGLRTRGSSRDSFCPIALREGGKLRPLEATSSHPFVAFRQGERWALVDVGGTDTPSAPFVFVADSGETVPIDVGLFRGYEATSNYSSTSLEALGRSLDDALKAPWRRRRAARNRRKRESQRKKKGAVNTTNTTG